MNGYSLVAKEEGGIPGGIGSMPQSNHVTFYVQVDDVAASLALAESKGAKTAFGPHPVPDGAVIGGFFDPEGHLIGIVHPAAK
jgi:predicted enzyme related to lactoylglutathione lyase